MLPSHPPKPPTAAHDLKVTITPTTTTREYYPDIKNVKISEGTHLFATNVYRGTAPPPAHWPPNQNAQEVTPSHTTYYARANGLEITGGEFIAVSGTYVDTRPAPSAPGPGRDGGWGWSNGVPPQPTGPQQRFDTGRGYASFDPYGQHPNAHNHSDERNQGPTYARHPSFDPYGQHPNAHHAGSSFDPYGQHPNAHNHSDERNNEGPSYARSSFDPYGQHPNAQHSAERNNQGPIYAPTFQEEPQPWNGPMTGDRAPSGYNAPQDTHVRVHSIYRQDSTQPSSYKQMPQPIGYPVPEIGNQGRQLAQMYRGAAFGDGSPQPRASGSRGEGSSAARRQDVNEGMAALAIDDEQEVGKEEEAEQGPSKKHKKSKSKSKWVPSIRLVRKS